MIRTIATFSAGIIAAVGLFIAGDSVGVREQIMPVETPNPSVLGGSCPAGWEYGEFLDHAVTQTCTQSQITMTMYPYVNFGFESLDTKDPNARPVACADTPDWPKEWCLG